MRTWILIVSGIGFLFLGTLAILYFSGRWIPNYPSHSNYPVRGIDVSGHQGRIDWKKVSASGIRFVYLKATEGGDFQDAFFKDNLQGARDAGLVCGAYHFFRLNTPGNVQAQNFAKTVPGSMVNLPPAVDLEFLGNSSARPSPEAVQADLRVYLDTIRNTYRRLPVIYCSSEFSDAYLKGFIINKFWARDILLNPDLYRKEPWFFWQFSDRGRVPGINGCVDMDVFHGPADHFDELTRNFATP